MEIHSKSELVDEEIFEGFDSVIIPVVWWLVHLLGGKVIIPVDEDFWVNNYPPAGQSRLVLRPAEGEEMKMELVAEQTGWVS